MIARFDHRPMLTAVLALSTTVLLVVVVTLSTLLFTLPQGAEGAPSLSGGSNPAAPAPKVMDAESYGEVYGWNIQAGGSDSSNDAAIDSQAEVIAAIHKAK